MAGWRALVGHAWATAVAGLLAAIALAPAGGCVKKNQQLPITADSVSVPYQVFTKANLFFYDGARKKWRLDALHMRKELDTRGMVTVAPVRLTLYDSLGNAGTTVVADSGTTNSAMENFSAWGNVQITTDENMVVRTQRLQWNKNTHRITSDVFVQIRTANGVMMRGKGLDAYEDFSQWSFKSNFTGEIPNFKERMEGEEFLF